MAECDIANSECIFDSDRVLTKPDFSKLDISKFEEYSTMCFLLFHGNSDKIVWEINRVDRTFHLRIFTEFPKENLFVGEYYQNENSRLYENLFDIVNSHYGLVDSEIVKNKIKMAPFSLDGEVNRWWQRAENDVKYTLHKLWNMIDSMQFFDYVFNTVGSISRAKYLYEEMRKMHCLFF